MPTKNTSSISKMKGVVCGSRDEIKITSQLLRDLHMLRIRGQINAGFLLYPSVCSEMSKFNQLAISRVFDVGRTSLKCFLSPSVWYDKHCIYMSCLDEFNATYSIANLRTHLSMAHKLKQFDALKTLFVAEGISTTASDAARVISDIVRRRNKSESDVPLRPGPLWYGMLSTDIIISHTTIRGIIMFLFDIEGIDGISRHECSTNTHESVYYDTHGRIFRVSVTDGGEVDDFYVVAVYECEPRDIDATLGLLDKMMEVRESSDDDVWICLSQCILIRNAERWSVAGRKNTMRTTRQHTMQFFHPVDRVSFLSMCLKLTGYLLNSNDVNEMRDDDGAASYTCCDWPGVMVWYDVGLLHATAPFETGLMHPVMLRMYIRNIKRADRSSSHCIKAAVHVCGGYDDNIVPSENNKSKAPQRSVSFNVPLPPPAHQTDPSAGQR